jgi:hypothetical protein
MLPVGDGTYAFKITVFAVTTGVSGNIPRSTALVPDIAPSNVAAIFAAVDFTKGVEPATNAEYIAKLPDGLAAKTIGGSANKKAIAWTVAWSRSGRTLVMSLNTTH